MPDNAPLPRNLKDKVSRFYVSEREFKNDSGENIKYERLVIELLVKGEVFDIEFKLRKKIRLFYSLLTL